MRKHEWPFTYQLQDLQHEIVKLVVISGNMYMCTRIARNRFIVMKQRAYYYFANGHFSLKRVPVLPFKFELRLCNSD